LGSFSLSASFWRRSSSRRQVALYKPQDLKDAFTRIEKQRPQAWLCAPSGLLFIFRREIAGFAAKQRLPALYWRREVVESAGLMSLSPNIPDIAMRGVSYVDKILKGADRLIFPSSSPPSTNWSLI
jgi:putative ABC transport system substrate-binding protein